MFPSRIVASHHPKKMGLQRSLSQILRPAMIFWQGALELPKAPDVHHEFDRIMEELQARWKDQIFAACEKLLK
jgi:hypothetical protein